MLSGAQLGTTVTGLVVGFLAEPSVSALIKPALEGTGLSASAVSAFSVVLALVVATVLQMVLGELAPKTWPSRSPNGSPSPLPPPPSPT